MSLMDDLRERDDVAFAFAGALEPGMGDNALLTVGLTRDALVDTLAAGEVRVVVSTFTIADGTEGLVALVALRSFAEVVERGASDELLLTTAGPALDTAVNALGAMANLDVVADHPDEWDSNALTRTIADAPLAVYPILDGTDVVACVVVALGVHIERDEEDSPRGAGSAASAVGAPLVLADVEMGVTAELGRCRMSIRDLLSLTPGAVIDLDRAAGAPVDVLVNGTLIARGEVVVIEEEFGIRISEILKSGAAAH